MHCIANAVKHATGSKRGSKTHKAWCMISVQRKLGLADFPVGLVDSILCLPDGQVKSFGGILVSDKLCKWTCFRVSKKDLRAYPKGEVEK